MSAAQHTPGPWTIKSPEEIGVHAGTEGRVAILTNLRGALGMSGRRDPEEVMANARLIAAAPELLEALVALEDASSFAAIEYYTERETVRKALSAARAAIAKATGSAA